MGTTIYYFSGTGNSLKVAKDLKNQLEDSKLVKISNKSLEIIKEDISNKIGFVYPVYFNGLPAMVKEFIENLQVNENSYIFAVATFGGGPGISFSQINDILNKKGTSLSAGYKIAMPGNAQTLYPPFSQEKQEKLFLRANEQVIKIAASVKRNDIDKSNNAIGIKKAIGGVLYNIFNQSEKDKNFWITDKCNGCGTCSKVCPAGNIGIVDGKPKWKHKCELCLACMQWCPQKSIQYKKRTLKRGRYHHPQVKVNELYTE